MKDDSTKKLINWLIPKYTKFVLNDERDPRMK